MRASIDKDRDMARSILPSKNREAARAGKARVKRAARRGNRQACRGLANLDPCHSDDWDARFDLRAYPEAEINLMVDWRRSGDKLNHFQRWAVARTKHLPLHERFDTMAAVVPDGLIGDHALSHLRWVREINPDSSRWWHREDYDRRKADRERAHAEYCRCVRLAVTNLVERGGHRELNAAIKQTAVGQTPRPERRLLAGVHDIDDFVAAVTAMDGKEPKRPAELRATMLVLDRSLPGWRAPSF